MLIVITYAYMLFQVEPIQRNPSADLTYFLLGYLIVFGLYASSGVMRLITHGRNATSLLPIVIAGALFGGIIVLYRTAYDADWCITNYTLNVITIVTALVLMRLYRLVRPRYRKWRGTGFG